jgi:hypothetical protein
VVAYWLIQPLGPQAIQFLLGIIPIGGGVFASLAAWRAWKFFHTQERRVWAALFWGLVLWTAAEVIQAILVLFLGENIPYPSLADLFWLGGYIPFGLAVLFYLRYHRFELTPAKEALAVLGGGLLPVLLFVNFIRPVNASANASATTALNNQLLVEALYPPLDLLLAVGALMCVLAARARLWHRPWFLVGSGLAVFAYSDLWYWLLLFLGAYSQELFSVLRVEMPYGLAYLLVGLGCLQSAVEERAASTQPAPH